MPNNSQHTHHCPTCEQTARQRDGEIILRKRETALLRQQRDAEVEKRRAERDALEQASRERDEAVAENNRLEEYAEELLDQQGIIAQDRARRVKERDEALAEVVRLEAVREKASLAIEHMTQAVEQAEYERDLLRAGAQDARERIMYLETEVGRLREYVRDLNDAHRRTYNDYTRTCRKLHNAEAAHQLTIANYAAVKRETDTAWAEVERMRPVVETVKAWRDHSDYRADSVADELACAYDAYHAGNAHTGAGERSHTTNK